MPESIETFHSPCELTRTKVHVVLVNPEFGGNVGSVARGMANLGILGSYRIVGTPAIVDSQARRMAKHAGERLSQIQFYPTLAAALSFPASTRILTFATSSRVGSPNRPHPIPVDQAVARGLDKLHGGDIDELVFVFGTEGNGLSNEEVDACDWVVTIPTSDEYDSLNLSQAVLIFCYEVNRQLRALPAPAHTGGKISQKQRMVNHLLVLAETAGFILPGDPFKMRPRLEGIFNRLPNFIEDGTTLHGLIDQVVRSIKKGEPDIKGRYRHVLEESKEGLGSQGGRPAPSDPLQKEERAE